ncbi:FecR family protein [Pseudoduganella chitinolytica]|uniref:FecR family protein n=1 Tax=Pseudoduganella chitinolytica TaxID=34070 RepID=A0ABY8BAJ7_9BURK|nr:FecR family protein [Pseudoduganella chitinolytica]WEF32937.1 FecR family protein [Pseudoduganella chitinolytica]
MHKLLTASLMFVCCATAWAADAGRVVFVTGKAQLASKPAALDAVVQEGDDIVTGNDGYVYIKTVDNGFFILRPNSSAKVTAYHIDSANPANTRVKLELTNGVARAISGQGVKAARQNFRFNTPVAAIGVRGTDFIVFTDQHTSRVSVVSGGVVMAGFGGSCTAEGVGPCEGGASRELFAGQAGLLQIQRGQPVPQLLNNPALSPDQNEKPRSDEPVGKVAAVPLQGAQVNLDPQRELAVGNVRTTTNNPPGDGGADDGGNIVTTPPVIEVKPEPVVPLPPKPQEIFWGRWSTVAGDVNRPASFAGKEMDSETFVGEYMMGRVKGAPLVMPKEGTAAFTLANSEAFIVRNGRESVASVNSGSLGVNFENRTFTTALVVADAASNFAVNGRGTIDMKGLMVNDAASASTIRGYLSGAQAEEAAYIFRNTPRSGITVIGGTTWKK